MSGFDLSNFLAAFFDEARDRLVSINRGLVEFESETIDDEGLVALRRDAHTIKGSALMLGVTDVGGVAHLFEDAMENLIQNPELRVPKMIQFLYDLHDHLDERLEEVDTEPRLDPKALREDYERLLQEVRSGGGSAVEEEKQEETSLIGAEEAASWKKQVDSAAGQMATAEEEVATEEDVAAASEDEAAAEAVASVDIDAMMPDGMFDADANDDLLAAAAGGGVDVLDEEEASPALMEAETQAPLDAPVVDMGDDDEEEATFDIVDEDASEHLDVGSGIEELEEVLTFGDDFGGEDVSSLLEGEDVLVYEESQDGEGLASSSDMVSVGARPVAEADSEPAALARHDEEERRRAQEEARRKAEEEERRRAQEEARRKAEEEERRRAQEEARRKAEEEARRRAQEEARRKAEEEARRRAQEEARRKAEEKERRRAQEIARRKAAAEQARREAAEAARKEAEERARRDAERRAAIAAQAAKQVQQKAEQQRVEEAARAAPPKVAKAASGERQEKENRFRPTVAGEKSSKRSTGQRKASGRFLRVDAARLEELSSYVVELSTERSHGEDLVSQFRALQREFRELRQMWNELQQGMGQMNPEEQARLMQAMSRSFDRGMRGMSRYIETQRFSQLRSEMMLKELRDQVLSLMLRPLDNIFSTFPRAVRDVAVKLGKRVKLVIDGSDTEIDQGISEALVEPLVHLLNNAVAHGVEMPEERVAAGKPPVAQVSIIARQSGNEIHIEVVDDGRGLDVDLIKATAVERGVTTQVEADEMDSAEILEMIFRPGFSTKKEVSDVSGRGIGMNVVQDTVRRLTGAIRIDSEKGQGTRFMLSLPVSIAVQHALVFRMAGQRFGMLIHLVEQVVPLASQKIEKGPGGKDFMRYGHQLVALVDMRQMLADGDGAEISEKPYVIIAEHIEGFVGIVVDEMYDEMEIVVRDLDPYIKRYQPQGLMGTTIATDGSVLILLEPYGIKEMGRTAPDQAIEIEVAEEEKMDLSVLLVEDSLIARQIEKGVFESMGFTVETAIDGMDGLEKLQKGRFDLVVTDLEMPRLDGFGFVRRIRNQPEYEDLPIMVISTRESAEDRMRALEAGADSYMIKQQLQGEKIMDAVQSLVGSVPAN